MVNATVECGLTVRPEGTSCVSTTASRPWVTRCSRVRTRKPALVRARRAASTESPATWGTRGHGADTMTNTLAR